MSNNKLRHILQIIVVIGIFLLFCYFRLKPIFFQTVPYTYDQGRDFLKAEEIVLYKNPTLIGPTTGIMGVFHGAWWYYLLAFIFAVCNGSPQGFYVGIFCLMLISTILFYTFLKKEFHALTSLLFLLIVTISSYFIGIAFFPGNNIMEPPIVLLFIFSLYKWFKTQRLLYLSLLGLSIGFIFEAEVSFGMFLIPAFIITSLFFPSIRNVVIQWKKLTVFLGALTIPFLPRILFELTHNFLQTRTIIEFTQNPTKHNVQTIQGAFNERSALFWRYYSEIFYNQNVFISLVAIGLISIALLLMYKKREKHNEPQKNTLSFLTILSLTIFILTLFYKNNFFWVNYLEGIQYIFLFMALLSFNYLLRIKNYKKVLIGFVALYGIFTLHMFIKEVTNTTPPPLVGLRADIATINKVIENQKENWCLRIYTPPIVPYTYDYLLNYNARTTNLKKPTNEFVENKCMYIIDRDDYMDRVEEWKKKNIPEHATLIKSATMPNGTAIQEWSL